MGISTPCKVATPQLKFGIHDYIRDITPRAYFGVDRLGGGSPQVRKI